MRMPQCMPGHPLRGEPAMTARIIPVDAFDLVVFGGTGDSA
jgi:hypothetical protein